MLQPLRESATVGDLSEHIIRHMSEKPDECTVCELYLVSTAAASAAIAVDRAIAAVFVASVIAF